MSNEKFSICCVLQLVPAAMGVSVAGASLPGSAAVPHRGSQFQAGHRIIILFRKFKREQAIQMTKQLGTPLF